MLPLKMPLLMPNGLENVCRLRRSGNLHHVEALLETFILGAMNSVQKENGWQTHGKASFPVRTLLRMALLGLHQSVSTLPTNTVCMTYLVMFGNGVLTGIVQIRIRNRKVVSLLQSIQLDQIQALTRRNRV